jgi:hypothetical protein
LILFFNLVYMFEVVHEEAEKTCGDICDDHRYDIVVECIYEGQNTRGQVQMQKVVVDSFGISVFVHMVNFWYEHDEDES